MTELRRLLDGDSDELALALLRSANDDSPSTDSLKAAAVALGIGTSLGGAALLGSGLRTAAGSGAGAAAASQAALGGAPAATAGALTLGVIAKQVGIGLLAGVFAMGGLELAIDKPFSSPAPAAQKASISPARAAADAHARNAASGQTESMAALAAAESDTPSSAASPSDDGASDAAAARSTRRRAAASGVRAADAQGAPPAPAQVEAAAPVAEVKAEPKVEKPQTVALNKSLAAEVALLDRARSALLAQNASGAQRALDQYRKERQTGILDPEATVLEIQVLEKLGSHAAAARLARQFIASHPDSRHVESLRVLAADVP
jgi:hypothetical protein